MNIVRHATLEMRPNWHVGTMHAYHLSPHSRDDGWGLHDRWATKQGAGRSMTRVRIAGGTTQFHGNVRSSIILGLRVFATGGDEPSLSPFGDEQLPLVDANQLHTALNRAIASENYELAAKIRDLLSDFVGPVDEHQHGKSAADWRHLGVLGWLADRADDLGYRLPTDVQRRSAPIILDGADCVIEGETGSGKTLAFLLSSLSLLSYPPDTYVEDLKGPQLVIIVPTRELGVQIVMLAYKLLGGSVNPGVPGEGANMFRYKGPRGLKVRGLLLPDEVELAASDRCLALKAHVLVATPDLIAAALDRGVDVVQHARVLVVDEVDACVALFPGCMKTVMDAASGSHSSPSLGGKSIVTVLVGATLDVPLIEAAVSKKWIIDPVRIGVGRPMSVPAGLQHRYTVVPSQGKIGALCRQLLADLREGNQDAPPARVMLFADDEKQARALADPLRTVLWGEHAISVLLPGGIEPIKALHSFRDNKTTLLLATPQAARGLDLPAVSHVYSMSSPTDAADYLHRAGRAGRIGSIAPGIVTTIVSPEEEQQLLAIAEVLGVRLQREAAIPPPALAGQDGEIENVEEAKRALEAALAFSSEPGEADDTSESDAY